jgi:hypothetical protein
MAKKKKEEEDKDILKVKEDNLTLKLYEVSLPALPSMEIHAFNEAEAVSGYNSFLNVVSTVNKHKVMILK